MRATKTERVCARLREMGLDVPEGSQVHRTYPGPASGLPSQWTWELLAPDGSSLYIGSEIPMTLLLRIPRWTTYKPFSDTSIVPA